MSAQDPDPMTRIESDPVPAGPMSGIEAARLVYILYLIGFALPIVALGGLILAYAKRAEAQGISRSHLDFQIRSFWIGLAAWVIGGLLTLILVGWLVLALWCVWALARFITGLVALSEGRAVKDPEGWAFVA